MDNFKEANARINQLMNVKPTNKRNTMKTTINYTQETIRERQVQEYLISQYGEDYFSLDDLLNMCICDDGSVWIGIVEFKTPFKLES